ADAPNRRRRAEWMGRARRRSHQQRHGLDDADVVPQLRPQPCSGRDRVRQGGHVRRVVVAIAAPVPRARGGPMTRTYSCHWSASRPPRAANPAVEGDITADVAVIGGGYTGLATAYHLKSAEPSLDVAILEAETTGYGASGRNAGFVMTLFGSSVGLMKMLHGNKRIREAHDYMVGAIDSLERMIADNSIDCDYERSGFLRVATT